jgi:hypothetical protein
MNNNGNSNVNGNGFESFSLGAPSSFSGEGGYFNGGQRQPSPFDQQPQTQAFSPFRQNIPQSPHNPHNHNPQNPQNVQQLDSTQRAPSPSNYDASLYPTHYPTAPSSSSATTLPSKSIVQGQNLGPVPNQGPNQGQGNQGSGQNHGPGQGQEGIEADILPESAFSSVAWLRQHGMHMYRWAGDASEW